MSAFKNAVNNVNTTASQNRSTTANGAASLKSTLNPLVDLFFMIGSLRGKDLGVYKNSFDAAYEANPTLALQMILWARDIRGGAGERNTPRELLKYLEVKHPDAVLRVIPVLADFGRWDDLLIFKTAAAKTLAYQAISEALTAGNALCAKWLPRVYKFKKNASGVIDMNTTANKNRAANNKIAREIMTTMNINERAYRKLLSSLSNTVEQKMCANEWDEIEYSKLPSVASARYLPAFMKRDEARYREFLSSIEKGEVKVNAGALYPYDVTTRLANGIAAETLGVAQWEQLRNFMGDNKAIPMVDTSSSMNCPAGNTGMTCMNVAISLGLYIADKQEGAFKNLFLNFSTQPRMFELQGINIAAKYRDLMGYRAGQFWGGSTNIQAAFREVLRVAKAQQVPADQMPKNLIVLSDMEFNPSNAGGWNATAYNSAKADFAAAGYELPTIVFWNLNARPGNNPVRFDQNNVALVSGFSPSVLEAILSGEEVDPVQVMLRVIDAPRYQVLG
jgi:hypothetical protein